VDEVAGLFKQVWRLPCCNKLKEIWWALVHNALCTAERFPAFIHHPCVCGEPCPGRRHYFWDCHVALKMRRLLQGCLPGPRVPLGKEHVWLARPPAGQHAGLWLVAVLCVLSALDHSRRVYFRRSIDSITQPSVVGMSNLVHARFWALITEFCTLGLAPTSWRGEPCAFMQWLPSASGGSWQPCIPS
jgi:hypothetical protein